MSESSSGLSKELTAQIVSVTEALRDLLVQTREKGSESGLKALFDQYDTGNKGHLTLEEFVSALRENGISDNIDVCAALYNQLDTDGSDSLEYSEFIQVLEELIGGDGSKTGVIENISASLKYMLRQQKSAMALKTLFEKYDADGSGSLDAEEFTQILKEMGLGTGANAQDLKAVFGQFDVDGSGSVDLTEILKTLQQAGTKEVKKEEQMAMAYAKGKHDKIEKQLIDKKEAEGRFKEQRTQLETSLAELQKKSKDSKLNYEIRMQALTQAQTAAEKLSALEDEEKAYFEKWQATKITLTPEEQRLLRGAQAMHAIKKQLFTSSTFRKTVAQSEKLKSNRSPTYAEVKAKKKYVEETTAQINDEEKGLTTKIKILEKEVSSLQAKMEDKTMSLPEKLGVGQECMKAAEELKSTTDELEEKQGEWERLRETLKFTPDEQRILRGKMAMASAHKPQQADKGKDSALLQLRKSKQRIMMSEKAVQEWTVEKKNVAERIQDLTNELDMLDAKLKEKSKEKESDEVNDAVLKMKTSRNALQGTLDACKEQLKTLQEKLQDSQPQSLMQRAFSIDEARMFSGALAFRDAGRRASTRFPAPPAALLERKQSVSSSRSSSVTWGDATVLSEVRKSTEKLHTVITSQGGQGRIKELFNKYDIRGDGGLAVDEWAAALKELDVTQDEDVIAAMFNRYDADGSGSVEFEEFVTDFVTGDKEAQNKEVERIQASLRDVLRQKRGMLALKKLFEKYDTDGSGGLDVEEFTATMQDLGVGKDALVCDFQALFQKFDADGSGSLEFKEFLDAMNKSSKEAQKEETERIHEVKEKVKQQERQVKEKADEKEFIAQEHKRLETELAETTANANDPSKDPSERLVWMEQCVTLQQEVQQILIQERNFEDIWKEKEIVFTEEEMRIIRGLDAVKAAKQKLAATTVRPNLAAAALASGQDHKTPSTAEVKAKIVALEKAEAHYILEEQALREHKKNLEKEMELVKAAMSDDTSSAGERMAKATEAMMVAKLLEEVAIELQEYQDKWQQQVKELQLTKDEERVWRGVQAQDAMKRGRHSQKVGTLRRAKTKASIKTQHEKDLAHELEELEKEIEDANTEMRNIGEAIQHKHNPSTVRFSESQSEETSRLSTMSEAELSGKLAQIRDKVNDAELKRKKSKGRLQFWRSHSLQSLLNEEEATALNSTNNTLNRRLSMAPGTESEGKLKNFFRRTSVAQLRRVDSLNSIGSQSTARSGHGRMYRRNSTRGSSINMGEEDDVIGVDMGAADPFNLRRSPDLLRRGSGGSTTRPSRTASRQGSTGDKSNSNDHCPPLSSSGKRRLGRRKPSPYAAVKSVIAEQKYHCLPILSVKETVMSTQQQRLGALGKRKDEDECEERESISPQPPPPSKKSKSSSGDHQDRLPALRIHPYTQATAAPDHHWINVREDFMKARHRFFSAFGLERADQNTNVSPNGGREEKPTSPKSHNTTTSTARSPNSHNKGRRASFKGSAAPPVSRPSQAQLKRNAARVNYPAYGNDNATDKSHEQQHMKKPPAYTASLSEMEIQWVNSVQSLSLITSVHSFKEPDR